MAYLGRINTGTTTTGAISPTGDYDTFNAVFIQGLTYSVAAKGASSGNGTLVDPNIALYDANGTRLTYNDDVSPGINRDGQITFQIGSGGTAIYTLGVGETGNNATGSYTLTVSAGYATNAADRVVATNYDDAINGMGGNDVINGAGGNDQLFGGDGHDQLIGGQGNDLLSGNNGNDMLRGFEGADILYGGTGADRLTGGTGADRFVFNAATDSDRTYGQDYIIAGDGAAAMEGVGRIGGDVLDLRGIDANEYYSGNQAFVFTASRAAGTAFLSEWNGNTVFNGFTDNDGVVDVQIIIADGAISAYQYTADEFLL